MPITWGEADVSPATLKLDSETAAFTWTEFSVAYELYLLRGYHHKYKREEIYSDLLKDEMSSYFTQFLESQWDIGVANRRKPKKEQEKKENNQKYNT